jgi:hypothetical protein
MNHIVFNKSNTSPAIGADADAIGFAPNMTTSVPQRQHVTRTHDIGTTNAGGRSIRGMLRTCTAAAILAVCTLLAFGGLTGCGGGDKSDGGNGSQNSGRAEPESLPRGLVMDFSNGVRITLVTADVYNGGYSAYYENTNPSNGWPEHHASSGTMHYNASGTGFAIAIDIPRQEVLSETRVFFPDIYLTDFIKANGNFVGCTATIRYWYAGNTPPSEYAHLLGQSYTVSFSGTLPTDGTEGADGGTPTPPYSQTDVAPSLFGTYNLTFTHATGENLPYADGESKSIEIYFPNTLRVGERVLQGGHTSSEFSGSAWTCEWTDGELSFRTINGLGELQTLHIYVFRNGQYIGEFAPNSTGISEPTTPSYFKKMYSALRTKSILVNEVPENLLKNKSESDYDYIGRSEGNYAPYSNEILQFRWDEYTATKYPHNRFDDAGDIFDTDWQEIANVQFDDTGGFISVPAFAPNTTLRYRQVYYLDSAKKNLVKIETTEELYLESTLIWKMYLTDTVLSTSKLD